MNGKLRDLCEGWKTYKFATSKRLLRRKSLEFYAKGLTVNEECCISLQKKKLHFSIPSRFAKSIESIGIISALRITIDSYTETCNVKCQYESGRLVNEIQIRPKIKFYV